MGTSEISREQIRHTVPGPLQVLTEQAKVMVQEQASKGACQEQMDASAFLVGGEIRAAEPPHGGGVVGLAQDTVASAEAPFHQFNADAYNTCQELLDIDVQGSQMGGKFPLPGPSGGVAKSADAVVAGVGFNMVVGRPQHQEIDIKPHLGLAEKVKKKSSIRALLTRQESMAGRIGGPLLGRLESAQEMCCRGDHRSQMVEAPDHGGQLVPRDRSFLVNDGVEIFGPDAPLVVWQPNCEAARINFPSQNGGNLARRSLGFCLCDGQ